MATLEILEILGIRSFGPNEPQKLQFINPVTLIHGPNGTGKTTIIECLRYATTGDQPPNTKGGAFLFEPKLCDESTIKAQVKLQFKCVTGEQCLVSRSQQASRKAKNVTTKTVDTALKRKKKNGETVALDSRCADINAEMKHALGVSAPILQNVIFCHQEESNWPLSEGKALKQKFDDIFASTRYVKALENIAKQRKEMTAELKLKQSEIKLAMANKNRAAELQAQKEKAEKELASANEQYEKAVEQLKPVESKLSKIYNDLENINKVTVELVRKKSNLQMLERQADEVKDSLKGNVFNGSTEGLKQALREFENSMKEKEKEVVSLKSTYAKNQENINKIIQATKTVHEEFIRQKLELEKHETHKKGRIQMINLIERDYNITGAKTCFTADSSDCDLNKFYGNVKVKQESMAKTFEDEKKEFELQEMEVQKLLDDCRKNKTQLEESCRLKQQDIIKNRTEIRNISKFLSDVQADSSRLTSVQEELRRNEQQLSEAQSNFDLESLNAEKQQMLNDKNQIDFKLKQLQSEFTRANAQMKERTELDVLLKTKSEKQQEVVTLKAKIEDTIVQALDEFPQSNLKKRVDEAVNSMTSELKKMENELSELKMQKNSLEMSRISDNKKLKEFEEEIAGIKAKVTKICDISQFEETISKLSEEISAAQDTRGLLHGVKEMFARYHRMLTDPAVSPSDQKCPLCKRLFSEQEEVTVLATELDKHVKGLPARMEESERTLDRLQSKQDSLQQLVPQIQKLRDLEGKLPDIKTAIFDLSKKIDEKKASISKLESDVFMKQEDVDSLRDVLQDVYKLDVLSNEINNYENKIVAQKNRLSGLEKTRSTDEITEEQEELQSKLESIVRSIDRLQSKITSQTNSIQSLRTTVNDLNSEILNIQKAIQETCSMEQKKAGLEKQNQELQREIDENNTKLRPSEDEVRSLESRKQSIKEEREEKLKALSKKMSDLSSRWSELEKLQTAIDQYVKDCKAQKLVETEANLEKLRAKQQQIEQENEKLTNEIADISRFLAEHKTKERELNDNLKLRKMREEVDACTEEVSKINKHLEGLESTKLEAQRKELGEMLEKLNEQKIRTSERRHASNEEILKYKRELDTDQYRDAHKSYIKQKSALEVDNLAVKDLDKYHKALDRAIMEYHQRKMDNLNRLIKSLWKETYRGSDIDYIEICSDDMDESKADGVEAVDISKRRTYNYRVVMYRQSTPMDMRGRCSAGQKVLASLIIRLALAETFCISCGILALDEPTTNLDVENIESLAYALAEIIRSRKSQKNFQLIIITHDTQFVEILGREVGVQHYYKIGKNINGMSELKKSPIDDIVY